jgi:hypothetical protein
MHVGGLVEITTTGVALSEGNSCFDIVVNVDMSLDIDSLRMSMQHVLLFSTHIQKFVRLFYLLIFQKVFDKCHMLIDIEHLVE